MNVSLSIQGIATSTPPCQLTVGVNVSGRGGVEGVARFTTLMRRAVDRTAHGQLPTASLSPHT